MTPAALTATAEAAAIAAALCRAPHGLTVAEIVEATGLAPGVVARRLLKSGPQANRGGWILFRRDGERWGVTAAGRELGGQQR